MTASRPRPIPPPRRSYSPVKPLSLWQADTKDQEVRIEIIPLIDVIFCILTFFILGAVGLSRQQAISLDLPQASTGEPQLREMLVVSLDSFNRLYVEKQQVSSAQLLQTVRSYHELNPSGLMVLHAAKDARYSDVVEVLDVLRSVGGDRVALATLPGSLDEPESSDLTPTIPNGSLPNSRQFSLPNSGLTPGRSNPNLPGSNPSLTPQTSDLPSLSSPTLPRSPQSNGEAGESSPDNSSDAPTRLPSPNSNNPSAP